MASAFQTTTLPNYVKQNTDELLIKAATSAKTLGYIETRLNVKNKEAINILDTTVVFGDGDVCGFNAAGADKFTQRILEVKPIKVNKEWCAMDLRKTFANHLLKIAAGRETLPFEEAIVESNLAEISKKLEAMIWNGDETLGVAGLLSQINTATNSVKVTAAAGSTASQVIAETYAAIPEKAFEHGKVYIFVDPTLYRSFVAEQNATCCANREILDAAAEEMPYLGDTRVSVVPVSGLAGTMTAVGAAGKNLVYGTDIEDSEAIYDLWFSRDTDMFRLKVLFTAGTQVIWPDEAVITTIATA